MDLETQRIIREQKKILNLYHSFKEKEKSLEKSNDVSPTHSVLTGPLSTLVEKSYSNISGTTFYFVLQCKLNESYIYQKQKACSERIIHSSNIIAIQTLKFQKRKKYLNGSTLMVSNINNDCYKLFFDSSYVEHYDEIMYEYFFNGLNLTMSFLVKICLNNVR